MCIPLTPVLCFLYTVIIEVYATCFTESVSLRDIGKSTSRADSTGVSSLSSLYFKAVNGAHIGSALKGLTLDFNFPVCTSVMLLCQSPLLGYSGRPLPYTGIRLPYLYIFIDLKLETLN